jgi:hypothetical protein
MQVIIQQSGALVQQHTDFVVVVNEVICSKKDR